ncbi:secretion system protein E [Marinobacter halodurans]|uniref:Secretion system protein E n=1 Tax=Marinobacter halodurans TaxID=2528979 RepID=A0ABY1ZMH4_9GAMM|nr:ATPase, T2SS/T4P/T4SS family [Marinobacter halodurans]TBW57369.1 secretion system protein E [Marinobacter halodurans]
MPGRSQKLGEMLVARGIIEQNQLQSALDDQARLKEQGREIPIGKILVRKRLVDETMLRSLLERQKREDVMEIRSSADLDKRFGEIRVREVSSENEAPIVEDAARDHIVVCVTRDGEPVIFISPEAKVKHYNALRKAVLRAQKVFGGARTPMEGVHTPVAVTKGVISIIRNTYKAAEANEFTAEEDDFRQLVMDAHRRGATDIHFFRYSTVCKIKYRIRGKLRQVDEQSTSWADSIVSVGYGLGEGGGGVGWDRQTDLRRRIQISVDEYVDLDLRYEHAPGDGDAYHAVIRVLENDNRELTAVKPLESLGFTSGQAKMLRGAISKASGVTIIAGPTGSGKSTTMAQLLKWYNEVSGGESNILTVEAPIERRLPAFQTSVSDNDEVSGEEYARAIKGTLRRDPDFLMIGEIRDPMSATAMVSGVQSGHPLLTTVHAQSGIEIIERLAGPGMQVPPQTLGSPSFISALCYQMLLPKLNDKTKTRLTKDNMAEHLDADLITRLLKVCPNIDQAEICVATPTPDNPDGTDAMTICAEVIMPDEEMQKHFRRLEITEAYRHWRRSGLTENRQDKDLDAQVVGLSAQDHAIQKMLRGMIDPRDVESYFGFLNMQQIMSDGVFEEGEGDELFQRQADWTVADGTEGMIGGEELSVSAQAREETHENE